MVLYCREPAVVESDGHRLGDGDGGVGRRNMGESRGVDADGVQGRQPGRIGDVADGGDDTQGEGGVSGNRAGGSNMEITNFNPQSPTRGDKAP